MQLQTSQTIYTATNWQASASHKNDNLPMAILDLFYM
jgi:hypothetical protein